jgi:hypothetical protein
VACRGDLGSDTRENRELRQRRGLVVELGKLRVESLEVEQECLVVGGCF